MRWVERISPVSRSITVIRSWSPGARTRVPGVGGADAEVVHAAGAADAHFALGVEPLVSDPVVSASLPVGRGGLQCGPVCLAWGLAVQRAVGALLVVMLAESVELLLGLRGAARRRPGSEPALESLVKALDLSLRLGMAGRPVLLADAEHPEQVFERVAASGEPECVDAAVNGQRGCGRAVLIHSREEHGHDLIAAHRLMDRAGQQIPRVVIEPVQDLHIAAAEKPRVG